MKAVLTSSQMARSDRYTIQELGIPGLDLMEAAAGTVVDTLMGLTTGPVVVLAGGGNNGGDGFAIARLLRAKGVHVRTFAFFPVSKLSGDALTNFRRLDELAPVDIVQDVEGFEIPRDAAWLVDALFGTGLSRPLGGRFKQLVEKINCHPARVISVDLPSGLNGNHGEVIGPCVHADVTVTFATYKLAHVVTPACAYCGEVVVKDIGIVLSPDVTVGCYLLEASDFSLPARASMSHKGSFGTLGVVGGTGGMEGAANLAACAALRMGAGKVRILTDRPDSPRFIHDSVMVGAIPEEGCFEDYSALVIGPGLGRSPELGRQLRGFKLNRPTVWDADGLFWWVGGGLDLGSDWVMTPHPGEAARLLGCSAVEVQARRLDAIRSLSSRYPNGWILLKGFRSLICGPDGVIYVLGTGNPALATAGSGDVLAGMIGGLLAQAFPIADAVTMAALRHGMAADRWSAIRPEYAMIAEDLIADLATGES